MRLLIDTHILLWALGTPERLGAALRDELEDPANQILFGTASIWEIAIKAGLRKADFTTRLEIIAREALARGFGELTIGWCAAARVADLPHLHRDPFDRILVAQALAEPIHLLTADRKMLAYSDMARMADVR
jgi:PIN domain nuclease of toxin-antitoxin system